MDAEGGTDTAILQRPGTCRSTQEGTRGNLGPSLTEGAKQAQEVLPGGLSSAPWEMPGTLKMTL